jgi:hypothetical protein
MWLKCIKHVELSWNWAEKLIKWLRNPIQHVFLSSVKAPASAPASAVVGGQRLCAHSVATFCVATECCTFLSSGATTRRRGAGDLVTVEASGDNVNLLLPGSDSESPLHPNWRACRPAEPARAPPGNILNIDIGNVFNKVHLVSTFFNLEFQFISTYFNLEFQFIVTYFNIRFHRITRISTHFWAKRTKLHYKSPTAEWRHVLCVGVGGDRTHAARPQGSSVCPAKIRWKGLQYIFISTDFKPDILRNFNIFWFQNIYFQQFQI